MFKKLLLFSATLLFSILSYGQGETANWYFGNRAGITFNQDGSVTPLTDGRINTFEGCTSISDASGNLLFYTDGITVYNRDHQIMQNGTNLYGDPSSTQSAIIVPKPGEPDQLYIFTVDTSSFEGDPDRGLNYSLVDVSLNDGAGEVIEKNVRLLNDCSEKITAVVKDCFDQSIWVLALASENGDLGVFTTYHAFEVNTSGVSANAVKSQFEGFEVTDPRGYLKFAADGTKLASANSFDGLYLYDFDKTTGILSNQELLRIDSDNKFPYGIEFSPNQQYLYTHTSNNAPANEMGVHSSSLLQFDLTAPNISDSMVELDHRPIYRGALQLGENGKIYRTIADNYFNGQPFLGLINNPNEKGNAANYVHNAIALAGRNSTQGLPPFIQSFFNKTTLVKNDNGTNSNTLSKCEGDDFTLEIDQIDGAVYNWEKDGIPFDNPSPRFEVFDATIDDAGRYTLEVILPNPSECPIVGEAFVIIDPIPDTPHISLTQCDVDLENSQDGITKFNLEQVISNDSNTYEFYESTADIDNNNPIINPNNYTNTVAFDQTIYYSIINGFGCANFGELELIVVPTLFSTEIETKFYSCDNSVDDNKIEGTFDLNEIIALNYQGFDVAFYESTDDAGLETNPLTAFFTTASKVIYTRIENNNQCLMVDQIELIVNPTPEIDFPNEILFCDDGDPIQIDAPLGYDSYQWYKVQGNTLLDRGKLESTTISETGNYVLEVGYVHTTENGTQICTNDTSFSVIPSNRAIIQNIEILDISDNNTVEVLVTGDGVYEYSLDGTTYQDANIFENVPAGFYTIYIRDKNGCGITETEIAVIGYPKFFTPNGDGHNDVWQIQGVSAFSQVKSLINIYDRYGKLMAQITPKNNGWNGSYNNQPLPSSDYWFHVQLEDGREFKGHFALKR